ncbi:hypothetical protein [Streptomyces aureoversilis]|uniref:Transposase n=1 Tax=Streptomyces aureoversilis TaxID=67277 RepID=A0ABV9ZT65_9ACTN
MRDGEEDGVPKKAGIDLDAGTARVEKADGRCGSPRRRSGREPGRRQVTD